MSISVNLIMSINFFVNLLHSPAVWLFDIWHVFDNLISFDILTHYLNHLSLSQGYFSLIYDKFDSLCNRLNECNCDCEELAMHCMCIWPPIAWITSILYRLPPNLLPHSVHALIMRWSHLPPHWSTNQHHCVTCTLPSNQSANHSKSPFDM